MEIEEQQAGSSRGCPVGNPGAIRPGYFDPDLKVWVLSRYADVQAALHEADLWPVGPHGEGELGVEERAAQTRRRAETQAALPAAKLAEWKAEFEPLAEKMAAALPDTRPVDVDGEFARPWSLELANRVTGADPAEGARLAALAAKVTASTADPEGAALKAEAEAAGAELDHALLNSSQPMAGPAFVALSQTVPCLLANAWLMLLNEPREMERLRTNPGLLPRAVEELLRVAGLARVLHRQAVADVTIGDLRIECGQRIELRITAANHDPANFLDPERLDVARRESGQFAMGAGQHSCAASALIRMAMGVATRAFADYFTAAETGDRVQWHGGSAFRWPSPVYAMRRAR